TLIAVGGAQLSGHCHPPAYLSEYRAEPCSQHLRKAACTLKIGRRLRSSPAPDHPLRRRLTTHRFRSDSFRIVSIGTRRVMGRTQIALPSAGQTTMSEKWHIHALVNSLSAL